MRQLLHGGLLSAWLTFAASGVAFAAGTAGSDQPLMPGELLQSSAQHYPLIIKALAARRMAGGKALEADGAFDVVFDVEGFRRTGYYEGMAIEGKAKRRFRSLGGNAYAGYKISNGDFPVYEDKSYTNAGGALKVGVLFSLLRDRDIDEARFGLTDAEIGIREAELDLLMTRVGVQQQALEAYWRWVMLGRQLLVYEDLLRIATERQEGLEEQFRRGAVAEIFLTENLQNQTRRKILVATARRNLKIAANALSLFYRDHYGEPILPDPRRLPPTQSAESVAAVPDDGAAALSRALSKRPELGLLHAALEREQNRLALQRNALKPQLDVGIEVQQAIGGVAEGGPSRDDTDAVVGVTFSIPLQQRAGRGRLEQTQAEVDQTRAEQRYRQEQVEIEIRNLLLELTYASDLVLLADEQVRQSELMRVSEQRRFRSGASDFFLVNLREESAADARIKLHEAELDIRVARSAYDAATMNLERLELDGALN